MKQELKPHQWKCLTHDLIIGDDCKDCPICKMEKHLKHKVKIKGKYLPSPEV